MALRPSFFPGGSRLAPQPAGPNGPVRDAQGYLDNSGVTEYFSPLPNLLDDFNHYNYIITLGVVSGPEYNNPNTYMSNDISAGFSKIILRSSGGGLANRVRTYAEGDKDAEYFIDNLQIDAVISSNTNTGIAYGTNISFTVIEPYSMGKFIEAIQLAASESGFSNHTEVPLIMRIDFVGWENEGDDPKTYDGDPIFVPIKITRMNFQVTEQGSTYEVEAITYSDIVLSDNVDSLMTDIGAAGETVADVLQNYDYYSLTETINRRYEELEEQEIFLGYDRFLIVFPDTLEELIDVVQGTSERLGVGNNTDSGVNIYTALKEWSRSNVNELGQSLITEEISDGRMRRFTDAEEAMDSFGITDPTSVPTENAYLFQEGTSIQSIIEEVSLSSRYATENAIETDSDGFRQWFRINQMVFLDETPANVRNQLGRPRRVYVYAVYPYKTHEARHLPASQMPRGIENIRTRVRKVYDYLYTGKNTDVLNFQINFDYAYFQLAVVDASRDEGVLGARSGDQGEVPGLRASSERGETDSAKTAEGYTVTNEEKSRSIAVGTSDSLSNSAAKRIAQSFHYRLINSTVDMVQAEIEIWGDPYFIPSDLSSFSIDGTPTELYQSQKRSMPYKYRDIHIIVNFETPIDYNDGLDGLMFFPEDNVRQFSGLFQVISVTNQFSQGKFTQTLKLIRVINQNVEPTNNNTNPTEEFDLPQRSSASDASLTANFNADGTIAGPGQLARPGARPAPTPAIPRNTQAAGGITITPTFDPFGDRQRIIRTSNGGQFTLPGAGGAPPTLPTGGGPG